MQKSAPKISVIDAETDPFNYGVDGDIAPFIWGMYDERGFQTFSSTKELIAEISGSKRIFYAHNGGKFDFHFLLDGVNCREEITVINGRIARAKIGQGEIRDSFCLLPEALDKITQGKKIKIDYAKFTKLERNKHMEEISDYLRADCEILYTVILEFLAKHEKMPLTLAGAAMNWYAKNCNGGIKPTVSTSTERQTAYFDELKPWYFGGRVQAFRPGILNAEISTWDINSAYPAAMMLDHPAGPVRSASSIDGPGLERKLLKVSGKNEGFFPTRKRGGGLDWTSQRGIFSVTGWEYIAALELGFIPDKIMEVWEFPNTRNFRDYVKYWHAQKQSAPKKSFARLEAKLFLNSLYGKFGQNPSEYQRHFLCEIDECENFCAANNAQIVAPIGENMLVESPILPEQMRYYDVATALSITGFVRAQLMRAIKSNDTVYCDTDNVHVLNKKPRGITIGENLGEWQAEFKAIRGAYHSPKLYCLEDKKGERKWASKGIQLPEGQEMQTLEKICAGDEYISRRMAPSMSLRFGQRYVERTINAKNATKRQCTMKRKVL